MVQFSDSLKPILQTELSVFPSMVYCLNLVNWCIAYLRDLFLDRSHFVIIQFHLEQFFDITRFIYADDTQLCCAFDLHSPDKIFSTISACISDIRTWMIRNKLKINDNKTEFLPITSSRANFTDNINLKIGNENIPPTDSCKSLGVMLDSHFTMDTQISNLCRATHFHLRNIVAIRDHLTSSATEQLIHSLLSSCLDYCNSLLYGVPKYKVKYLQRVQIEHCSEDCDAMSPTRSHYTLSSVASLVTCGMSYHIQNFTSGL